MTFGYLFKAGVRNLGWIQFAWLNFKMHRNIARASRRCNWPRIPVTARNEDKSA